MKGGNLDRNYGMSPLELHSWLFIFPFQKNKVSHNSINKEYLHYSFSEKTLDYPFLPFLFIIFLPLNSVTCWLHPPCFEALTTCPIVLLSPIHLMRLERTNTQELPNDGWCKKTLCKSTTNETFYLHLSASENNTFCSLLGFLSTRRLTTPLTNEPGIEPKPPYQDIREDRCEAIAWISIIYLRREERQLLKNVKLLRKGDGASSKSKKLLGLWSMIDYLPVTRICGPDSGLQASNPPLRITGRDGITLAEVPTLRTLRTTGKGSSSAANLVDKAILVAFVTIR